MTKQPLFKEYFKGFEAIDFEDFIQLLAFVHIMELAQRHEYHDGNIFIPT